MSQQQLHVHRLLGQVNSYQRGDIVERHIGAVLQFNRALLPALDTLVVDTDPRTLLVLRGTIPIEYRGGKYFIPVDIWLPEQYPSASPVVFVTPTNDMRVKPNHAHVDVAGRVYIRYLHSWNPARSTLVELTSMLSVEFSNDPPVYRYSQQQSSAAVPLQRGTQQQAPRQTREVALIRADALVRERLVAFVEKNTFYVNRLMAQQFQQKEGDAIIAAGIEALKRKREALKEYFADVESHRKELEGWCDEHDAAEPSTKESLMDNVDKVVVPANTWSKQTIEAVASDHAIDDMLYCLDKALQDGRIQFESYLKKVRALAREQFFARALSIKIEGKQMALLQMKHSYGSQAYVSSIACDR